MTAVLNSSSNNITISSHDSTEETETEMLGVRVFRTHNTSSQPSKGDSAHRAQEWSSRHTAGPTQEAYDHHGHSKKRWSLIPSHFVPTYAARASSHQHQKSRATKGYGIYHSPDDGRFIYESSIHSDSKSDLPFEPGRGDAAHDYSKHWEESHGLRNRPSLASVCADNGSVHSFDAYDDDHSDNASIATDAATDDSFPLEIPALTQLQSSVSARGGDVYDVNFDETMSQTDSDVSTTPTDDAAYIHRRSYAFLERDLQPQPQPQSKQYSPQYRERKDSLAVAADRIYKSYHQSDPYPPGLDLQPYEREIPTGYMPSTTRGYNSRGHMHDAPTGPIAVERRSSVSASRPLPTPPSHHPAAQTHLHYRPERPGPTPIQEPHHHSRARSTSPQSRLATNSTNMHALSGTSTMTSSTSTKRSVHWNENMICPSPILSHQRRKGWFNRRGDQLWTNTGAYKPPTPGEFYPPDLDSYPDYGEGWQNEHGVRIDMCHRLIPKKPLRSALKRRPGDNIISAIS